MVAAEAVSEGVSEPVAGPLVHLASDGTAIAIIPAKATSRRCPGKNIRDFMGKPMLARAIETARESGLFSEIVVSTDGADVAAVAKQYGATVHMRSGAWEALGTQAVAGTVLQEMGVDHRRMACVLYATTPLLLSSDLNTAADRFDEACVRFIMAVGAEPLRDAGAFYMGLTADFVAFAPLISAHTQLCVLPEERVCDVNTEEDWREAERKFAAMYA